MSFYHKLPAFQTGDLFSATRANQLLSNLDAVYGLDQRQETSYPQGWNYIAGGDGTWLGWVVFNGDRLVVRLDIDGDVTNPYTITFDDTNRAGRPEGAFSVTVIGGGPHTIALPGAAGGWAGYVQWEAYRIKAQGIAAPRYAYMTSSHLASIGSMPAFTNGTTLTAADLNTVLNATDQLNGYFNQPAVGGYSQAFGDRTDLGGSYTNGPASVGTGGEFYVWSQHRHSQFQFYITTAWNNHQEWLRWSVRDNVGWKVVWQHLITQKINEVYRVRLADVSPALDLTVGNWYRWRFQHLDTTPPANMITQSNVYWHGEERYETAGNWDSMFRWTYGDKVFGHEETALGDHPKLGDISHNLTWLNTNRRRWLNPVQRQALVGNEAVTPANPDDGGITFTSTCFAKRVHRWLAYQCFNEDTSAVLRWSIDGTNTFQSYDLPNPLPDDTDTAYFDMNQSPIKIGQLFYATGVKFAIQTPETS